MIYILILHTATVSMMWRPWRALMRAEVRAWALTDHDTTSGWNEAQQAADSNGLHFIPGVEITCSPPSNLTKNTQTTGRNASAS